MVESDRPSESDDLLLKKIFGVHLSRRFTESAMTNADVDVLWESLNERYTQGSFNLKEFLCCLERHLLIRTLSDFEGNQKRSSEFLNMKPTTMNAKCKRYNIKFETRVQ